MGSTSRSITCRWVALGDFLYICIVLIQLYVSSFSLWQMSSESEVFVGFANDAS
jgi:hypothetical protein